MTRLPILLLLACEHCSGTGRRQLTDQERNTREAMSAAWSSTAEIRERLKRIQGYDTSPTALCNRLNYLAARGLVERKPINGKRHQWRQASGRDIKGEAIEVAKWERTMRGVR
jgi:hypothetical protein